MTAARRHKIIVVCAALVALSGMPAAARAEEPRQVASSPFTSREPGSPTGWELSIDYVNPDDPDAKPYAQDRLIITMAEGTRIDTSVPMQCAATDAELMIFGPEACPPESRVGGGEVDYDFGIGRGPFPRFVNFDASFFNTAGQLIVYFETTNLPVPLKFAARAAVTDRGYETSVPPLPGFPPPDPFVAVKRVRTHLDAISVGQGTDRRGYITTPPVCPADGAWVNRLEWRYRDGVRQIAETRSPC